MSQKLVGASASIAFKNDHLLCMIPLYNYQVLLSLEKNIVNSSKLLHILRTIQMILDIWILSRMNTVISLYVSFIRAEVENIPVSLAWFVTKSCRELGWILPSS